MFHYIKIVSWQGISAYSMMNTLIFPHCWAVTEDLRTNRRDITVVLVSETSAVFKQQRFRQAAGCEPSQ